MLPLFCQMKPTGFVTCKMFSFIHPEHFVHGDELEHERGYIKARKQAAFDFST